MLSYLEVIFRNQFGSSRYASFLGGLGTLIDITSVDPGEVFLGGLYHPHDGEFHIVWQDDALQVSHQPISIASVELYID